MANIILKDKNGTDITHMGIDYLCMRTLEGGLVRFNEGDIRVISVDELPSENIKEDAIYKVSATDEDGNARVVFYTYVDGEWTEYKVGEDPVFENLEITENGTYTPAEGVDGWSEVTVNVESNPVLTELVVTENGVYDEPTAKGEVVISWDGIVGDRPVIDYSFINQLFVKVSDRVLTKDELVGGIVQMSDGQQPATITEEDLHVTDISVAVGTFVISCSAPGEMMGIVIPESGTYLMYNEQRYIESLTFFASTPADGWNKVTVNVAGDIVDVEELPTEGIDEGKIYRVMRETEESVVVWLASTSGGEKKIEPFGDFLLAQGGMPNGAQVHYGFIESLDQEPPKPNDETLMNTYIWVLRETGIPYMYFEGSYLDLGTALDSDISICKGYIDDPHMAPEWNFVFYSVHTPAESSTTYGIPDEANNKTVFEHNGSEWVECGAGSGSGGGLIEVAELPTENIDPNAIYKVTDTGEMYMYGTTARLMVRVINDDTDTVVDFVEQGLLPVHDIHYLIVDEMPSIAYTIFAQNGIGVMYILKETGEPWFMAQGQIVNFADDLNSFGDMPWLGMTSNVSAETEPGVYTEMVSGWNKIRVFTESVKSA